MTPPAGEAVKGEREMNQPDEMKKPEAPEPETKAPMPEEELDAVSGGLRGPHSKTRNGGN